MSIVGTFGEEFGEFGGFGSDVDIDSPFGVDACFGAEVFVGVSEVVEMVFCLGPGFVGG